ncbi:MAG TPA: PilZ domain-containing protein [Allosphingosinicella sp.]|nr:PilZ domain-containing protein [Allosphingosinicella sp.]
METVYSLSGEVPPVDGAREADDVGLWPGALTVGSVRQVCSIRKMSAGGAVLHVDQEVTPGERLDLELMTGEQLGGTVAWRRGSEVGLRFDAPVDVFAIIAQDIVSQPGERRRMPRVETICSALLETAAGTELVTTRDISQGGAKIDVPFALVPEERIVITVEGLPPIPSVVRWSGANVAGIAFVPELRWQELMLWLKQRRKSGPDDALGAPGAPDADRPAPPPVEPGAEAGVQLNLPARVREGTRRWSIDVASITTRSVSFDSFAALGLGSLLWVVLPGLEGWPARIVTVDGYRFTCEFTQPLHPAVLERILALATEPRD